MPRFRADLTFLFAPCSLPTIQGTLIVPHNLVQGLPHGVATEGPQPRVLQVRKDLGSPEPCRLPEWQLASVPSLLVPNGTHHGCCFCCRPRMADGMPEHRGCGGQLQGPPKPSQVENKHFVSSVNIPLSAHSGRSV